MSLSAKPILIGMKQKLGRTKRGRVSSFSPTKVNFVDGRRFIRA